jgi:hypothetical protein
MRMSCGLDRAQTAKLLHVTERTLHNWETGVFHIPYAAYKLMRLMNYFELPGKGFEGWHVSNGCLYTPENHCLDLSEFTWWNNLYGRAKLFHVLYHKHADLQKQLTQMQAVSSASGGCEAPTEAGEARLDLSLGHFRTSSSAKPDFSSVSPLPCPAQLRYRFGSHLPRWIKGAV